MKEQSINTNIIWIQHTVSNPNLIDLVQFDPLCITENPTENDNRPFQYTRTQREINMLLDQQQAENTQLYNIYTNKPTNFRYKYK